MQTLSRDKRNKLAYHLIHLLWDQINTGAHLRREQQDGVRGWSLSGHNLAQSGLRLASLEALYEANEDTFRNEIDVLHKLDMFTGEQYTVLVKLAYLVGQAMHRSSGNNRDHPRTRALVWYWSQPATRSKGYRKVESHIRGLFVSPQEQQDIDTEASEADAIRRARRRVMSDMKAPTVAQLKTICQAVGVKSKGNKSDMAKSIADGLIYGTGWRQNLDYFYNTTIAPAHTFGINVPDWETF